MHVRIKGSWIAIQQQQQKQHACKKRSVPIKEFCRKCPSSSDRRLSQLPGHTERLLIPLSAPQPRSLCARHTVIIIYFTVPHAEARSPSESAHTSASERRSTATSTGHRRVNFSADSTGSTRKCGDEQRHDASGGTGRDRDRDGDGDDRPG